jgi:SOS-response transcriptional repressor LexA
MKVQRETRITLVRPVNVTEELKRLRERAGLSMDELARQIGYKNASSYQRYENATLFKKQYLPMQFIEKLIPILSGKGAPPIDSAEILSLAGVAEVVSKSMPGATIVYDNNGDAYAGRKIPVVDWGKINMFTGGKIKKEDIKTYSDPGVGSPSSSFVTDVPNSSMEPDFSQGDRVVCDRSALTEPGNVVIALRRTSGNAVIGRLREVEDDNGTLRKEIVPANSNWPTYRIDERNPGIIIGKVVEHRRTVR